MLKADIIDIIATEAGLKRSKAASLVDLYFDEMAESLKRGEKIDVRGFGIIEVKTYDARQGRNPKTGESVSVPSKKVPRWRTSGPLKKRMGATAKDEKGGSEAEAPKKRGVPSESFRRGMVGQLREGRLQKDLNTLGKDLGKMLDEDTKDLELERETLKDLEVTYEE